MHPSFDDFAALYRAKRSQVVWTRLVSDLETPVSAMLKLAEGRPYSFLFESVEGGAVRGRYSMIGLRPDLIWRCRGDKAEVNRRPLTGNRDRFGRVDTTQDDVRAAVEESVGFFSRVERDARDVGRIPEGR